MNNNLNEKKKEYFELCKNLNLEELKKLMEGNVPDEEKGFYKAIYEHFSEDKKTVSASGKLKEFYEFCKNCDVNELDSFETDGVPKEQISFYMSVFSYFLQQRQKEIISGPFVI